MKPTEPIDLDRQPDHYRTIWISDVHLGTRGCKAEFLVDFLRWNESDNLFLVGDIIDGWQLKKSWYWPQSHNDVVQKVMRKARKGTQVTYIAGNHDEVARQFIGMAFGGILIRDEVVYEMLDGRKLLVIHGDQFDGVLQHAKWLAYLGDSLYSLALRLNHHFNQIRHRFGFSYWSLSQYLKSKVKNAVSFITQFEEALVEQARRRGYHGVVCGHIHQPTIRTVDGILYCNDGDWVESLTALAETNQGELVIIHWPYRFSNALESEINVEPEQVMTAKQSQF
jgi:UDP-2,3-diacylglucosamine pyrophosphatase LpxH